MFRSLRFSFSFLAALVVANINANSFAQDPVFSGPQAGEKLPPFTVKGAVGEHAGKEYDPIATADGKPVLLIFFHERTRPAFGMCRALTKYSLSKKESHDLATHLILLTDDPSSQEKWAQGVISRNFPKGVSVAVSYEGPEGPGAYGLNRNVTLTILVGNEGKVTSNHALVQPQLQADGPGVLKAIAAVTGGGEVPDIVELDQRYAARNMAEQRRMRDRQAAERAKNGGDQARRQNDAKLGGLLRAMINKEASEEEVSAAAAKVEEYIADNAAAKKELKRIVNTVVNSGKLSNYGTEAARKVLKRWDEEFDQSEADKL